MEIEKDQPWYSDYNTVTTAMSYTGNGVVKARLYAISVALKWNDLEFGSEERGTHMTDSETSRLADGRGDYRKRY